ncbi:MAG: PaaI family thioesterase [Deltaproteobacteria bacterium]|nr:MAG: PaaI family thioesterase [Deltaproteobacteria bacterium]
MRKLDREWLDTLEMIYRKAPISRTLKSDISFDDEGRAHFSLQFHPGVCHALGDIHGGIIGAMVDNATWFTAAAMYPNVWITTTEFHTYLIKTPARQNIYSEGWVIHRGKRLAVTRAEVRREDGELVAYGTATFVVLSHIRFTVEEVEKALKSLDPL